VNYLPTRDPSDCRMCGCYVTPQFRRVYGDEDRRAHRCLECDIRARIREGSAAGRDLDTDRHPDPLDHPHRFTGAGGSVDALDERVLAILRERGSLANDTTLASASSEEHRDTDDTGRKVVLADGELVVADGGERQ
jgi:hypothetical protein